MLFLFMAKYMLFFLTILILDKLKRIKNEKAKVSRLQLSPLEM